MCDNCHKPAMSLTLVEEQWICKHCLQPAENTTALIEFEQLEPNVKSSKAHIRDIKARRLDTKTGRMYYDKGSRSYFY